MTAAEMRAFAQVIVDGGPAKKAEVVAFMRAFLDVDLQAGGPAVEAARYLPTLPFEIEKTDTGIHMPRESNRSYSKAEGASLVAAIAKALG